jgi:orotidine-5'-phosphate decarboxylase
MPARTDTFPDRLAAAVRRRGPLCVGLDPRATSLPAAVLAAAGSVPEAFETFALKVLDLVEPFAGVVKPQAAFFEQYGAAGMAAMGRVLHAARERGFVTVLDAKRGDIASTAAAYAEAAFSPAVWHADALTVNPYLGADAVEPFVTAAAAANGGLFVLVRTSNPGGGLFQNLVANGRPLYRAVGDAVAAWNAPTLGACGLGAVGAVVGATNPRELAELRAALPDVWFLVPGYGAQGGTAADARAAFRPDGLGAIVNSSRGVTFPFHPDDPAWEAKIAAAARQSQAELTAG